MSTDCTLDVEQYLRRTGEFIMKAGLPIIAGTIGWTLYLLSMILAVCVLWWKGFTRARTVLLVLIMSMFIIDTVAFALLLYPFFHQTRDILLRGIFQGDGLTRVQQPLPMTDLLYNMLSLFMLIPGDCIVIWRAYAVWTRPKIIVAIPAACLLGCIINLPFHITCNLEHKEDLLHKLNFSLTHCRATNASAWILSFCANISATLMIFYTAWCYHLSQKPLRALGVVPRFTTVARIMQLLVESGFVYLLVMIFSITVSLYSPDSYSATLVVTQVLGAVMIHCVGLVPTLTILLISLCGSFDDSTVEISQPIRFEPPRVMESYAESGIEGLGKRQISHN
ncbi:hypothetical protein C8J56DRAFT_393463 [Mycena floridula]|nr:hypothetical protein C8J56DRAFT_393463 [Mycena floridula]